MEKISDLLAKAKSKLKAHGVANEGLDSLVLLSHAISFSKEQIIFNPDFLLSEEQVEKFFGLIDRRCKREPVSQIIQKREFYGHDFFVNSNVLDPRPDSEILIEMVLKFYAQKEANMEILELGCGSGCLITTLLKAFPNALATAIDISLEALNVAKINAEKNGVLARINFLNSDLFTALTKGAKFDLIISNPPYIPTKEIEGLQEEVKNFEPILALDGGEDGLKFYRLIAENSATYLKPDGKIILEIGCGQHFDVIKIFQEQGFVFVKSQPDLAGIERALCFSKAAL